MGRDPNFRVLAPVGYVHPFHSSLPWVYPHPNTDRRESCGFCTGAVGVVADAQGRRGAWGIARTDIGLQRKASVAGGWRSFEERHWLMDAFPDADLHQTIGDLWFNSTILHLRIYASARTRH